MRLRRTHLSTAALLPLLALAAYGVLGVFGHSLHGLLPCGDAACSIAEATADCGCCDHRQPEAPRVLGPARNGAEFRTAGHDASSCSLCTLLAKVKVGRLAVYLADACVRQVYEAPDEVAAEPALELILTGVPRGPPAC
jgi:hypothetical protein